MKIKQNKTIIDLGVYIKSCSMMDQSIIMNSQKLQSNTGQF